MFPSSNHSDPFGPALSSDVKALESHLSLLQDRLMSTLAMTETTEYEDIRAELDALSMKTPVTLLMELAQCLRSKVNFVEVGVAEGPSHMPRFTVVAVMDGRPFNRVRAGSKRDCKNGAAYIAWKTLIQEQQEKLKDLLSGTSSAGESRPKYLAIISHLEYMKLIEKNPLGFTGRKVLATIIMQRKQKKPKKDIFRVVSLAIGNRSILTANLSLDGAAVNDSHAEVLARRAFLRYLHTQLSKATSRTTTDSIFEPSAFSEGKFKVRSSVGFHLYVSDTPCGDASLFTKSEETTEEDINSTKPLFTSKQQGLLRTKIEAGEGAIPTEKGGTQNLISLQFGGRLRTMTCSDKILKWNTVGLQGAMLSHFMDPVYLNSLSVGNNYIYGHAARAVYYRLNRGEEKPPDINLPTGYRVQCCKVGHGALDLSWQDTEKSSAVAVVWTLGDETAEILDGTTGLLMYRMEERTASPESSSPEEPQKVIASNVSKRALLNNFLFLCNKLSHQKLRSQGESYHDYKTLATDYQTAKARLYDKLDTLGYGGWVKKPEELEYFSVSK